MIFSRNNSENKAGSLKGKWWCLKKTCFKKCWKNHWFAGFGRVYSRNTGKLVETNHTMYQNLRDTVSHDITICYLMFTQEISNYSTFLAWEVYYCSVKVMVLYGVYNQTATLAEVKGDWNELGSQKRRTTWRPGIFDFGKFGSHKNPLDTLRWKSMLGWLYCLKSNISSLPNSLVVNMQ